MNTDCEYYVLNRFGKKINEVKTNEVKANEAKDLEILKANIKEEKVHHNETIEEMLPLCVHELPPYIYINKNNQNKEIKKAKTLVELRKIIKKAFPKKTVQYNSLTELTNNKIKRGFNLLENENFIILDRKLNRSTYWSELRKYTS